MTEALLTPTAPSDRLLAEARRDLVETPLHNETVIINTSGSIYDPSEIGLPATYSDGQTVSIFGELSLKGVDGNSVSMALVRLTPPDGKQEKVFVAGLKTDKNGNTYAATTDKWMALTEGGNLSIGREHPTNSSMDNGVRLFGYKFTDDISRKHLGVKLEKQGVSITDTSSNGSAFIGVNVAETTELDESYDYSASHTIFAEEAARLLNQLKQDRETGQKFFNGRPVINRDTFPIDGYVDIRSWSDGGEAIVVDSKKYPEEFNKLRKTFDKHFAELGKDTMPGHKEKSEEDRVIEAIYLSVDETMAYDLQFVDTEMAKVASQAPEHRKAALNNYLSANKGVCRHMALAVSWLGGDAVERGLIKGRFTTEVNQSQKGNGAHEWGRFVSDVNPDGVYIIDVAQHFQGKLIDTLVLKRNGQEHWGYFRSKEERDYYKILRNGKLAVRGAGFSPTSEQQIITENDIPR